MDRVSSTTAALLLILTLCSTPALGRKWTDIKGRVIEAEYVDAKDGEVWLKRSDGKTAAVPLVGLSAEDQEYVRQRSAPTRPAVPTDWPESLVKDTKEALAQRKTDPVSSLLALRNTLESKKQSLSGHHKAWLAEQIDGLTPEASARLRRDHRDAEKRLDALSLTLIELVAAKLPAETWDGEPLSKTVLNRILSEQEQVHCIWQVSDATLATIGRRFEEGPWMNQVTLTSHDGFELVRVNATIRNVSQGKAKPYSLWAFEKLKRIIATTLVDRELPEEFQWLDDSFIYLVYGDGELITCSHVCQGSGLRGLGTLTISAEGGSGRIVTPPKVMKPGDETVVELVFSVPKTEGEYRLFVLGAAPVAFK